MNFQKNWKIPKIKNDSENLKGKILMKKLWMPKLVSLKKD